MGETVDELGHNLQKIYPENFRLTTEKHWEINIIGQWIQLPDHYWTGLAAIIGGITGLVKLKNEILKSLSFLTILAGFALVLDDLEDLIADAKKLWSKFFNK